MRCDNDQRENPDLYVTTRGHGTPCTLVIHVDYGTSLHACNTSTTGHPCSLTRSRGHPYSLRYPGTERKVFTRYNFNICTYSLGQTGVSIYFVFTGFFIYLLETRGCMPCALALVLLQLKKRSLKKIVNIGSTHSFWLYSTPAVPKLWVTHWWVAAWLKRLYL